MTSRRRGCEARRRAPRRSAKPQSKNDAGGKGTIRGNPHVGFQSLTRGPQRVDPAFGHCCVLLRYAAVRTLNHGIEPQSVSDGDHAYSYVPGVRTHSHRVPRTPKGSKKHGGFALTRFGDATLLELSSKDYPAPARVGSRHAHSLNTGGWTGGLDVFKAAWLGCQFE